MKILVNWLLSALAITVSAYLLPGVEIKNFVTALAVAVILGLINSFIRPVLILLTLPINILTLGLFTLVINACLILLTSLLMPGFVVASFWWALLFGIVLFFVNSIFGVNWKSTVFRQQNRP